MKNGIRLGISTCLLGERVRYDGQHKLDRFLAETLGAFVDYVPVCPEVECGLTVPREAMRLVGDPDAPRLMTQRSGIDHTDRMLTWAVRRVRELESEELCGFIFKSKSPSSGMERVKVYDGKGGLSGRGPGMFARVFMEHFPLLPVEDEGRLHDAGLRENFIERIFALDRYRRALSGGGASLRSLVAYQASHKLLLIAHSQERAREMGRLVAGGKRRGFKTLAAEYEALLLATLKLKSTPRKHVNVMQHAMGYCKTFLSSDEKQELLEIIDAYRREQVPLIVPITLLNHHVRKYRVEYLSEQVYLNPHPLELKLRNHA